METMDLRLEGIAAGSTKLFITGETAPNLFGESLLEDTLRETFQFLQSPTPDDLAEAVGQVGPLAAGAFQQLFKAIGGSQLALDVTWEAPDDQELTWSAEAWKVRQMSVTLSQLTAEEPEIIKVSGEIITLSARRPFELRSSEGIEYSARVPESRANDIKGFKVGQTVAVTFERQRVRNQITGSDKSTLTLLSMAAV